MGTSRRTFLQSGLSATGLTALAATRAWGANDRINVAVIGVGGRGTAHVNEYASIAGARVYALCDVDQANLERATALTKKLTGEEPKAYKDMQDVFADKNVHAVSMPLPNHWHALATVRACQAGKDVYIEKPACHDLWEGRQMVAAARQNKRIVQVGSQGRSVAHRIRAVQMLHDGVIGNVYLAKGLCFKRRKSIGETPIEAVPAGVDWDKFLGPAPMIPFSKNRFLYNWHWFWDTGNGDIGNQGVHEMDMARWGMGVEFPNSAVASGGKYGYDDDQETPNTLIARLDYGGREIVFEVRGLQTGGEADLHLTREGCIGNLFYGTEGWMSVDATGYRVYKGDPATLVDSGKLDESNRNDTKPHMENFLAAVRSRKADDLHADINVGRISADLCHLANISYRFGGEKLAFDPKTERFARDEANALGHLAHREPYTIPSLAE